MNIYSHNLRRIFLFAGFFLSFPLHSLDEDITHRNRICADLKKKMGESRCQWIHNSVNSIHSSRLLDFETVYREFDHRDINIAECERLVLSLMEATSKVSFCKKEFIQTCKDLLTPNMSSLNQIDVIECVAKIGGDFSWLKDFKMACHYFIKEGADRIHAIKSVSKARPFLYEAFINTCSPLMRTVEGMYEKGLVMESVLRVDNADKRQMFMDICLYISSKVPPHDRVYVIESISRVNSAAYENFRDTCKRLLSFVGLPTFVDVVDVVAEIPSDKYTESFTKLCFELSNGVDEKDRIHLLEMASRIEPSEYGDFKETFVDVSSALVPLGNSQNRVNIMEVLILAGRSLWPYIRDYRRQSPVFFLGGDNPHVLPKLILVLKQSNSRRPLTKIGLENIFSYLSKRYLPDEVSRKRQRQ